jgi:hypothetical protein
MPLIIGTVRNQRSATALATTLSDNINFAFRAHALHIDLYCLKNTTTASSLLVEVQKLGQVRINTVNGQPESTIDGQDLHDFSPTALGLSPYKTVLTAVDNDPHLTTIYYPFSPFPTDPTEPFGLSPGLGTQIDLVFIADNGANTFDTYTYDITVEGLTDAPSFGYVRFVRDAQTGVVGNQVNTKVYGRRFLGAFNFMTTSFDDLAAAAAIDVTTIRNQAILDSSAVILGPARPARTGAQLYLPQITAAPPVLLDNGSHFQNFGILNRGTPGAAGGGLGFDITGKGTIELQTTAGAADAYRTYPTTLI